MLSQNPSLAPFISLNIAFIVIKSFSKQSNGTSHIEFTTLPTLYQINYSPRITIKGVIYLISASINSKFVKLVNKFTYLASSLTTLLYSPSPLLISFFLRKIVRKIGLEIFYGSTHRSAGPSRPMWESNF